jgi:hypothetical protein
MQEMLLKITIFDVIMCGRKRALLRSNSDSAKTIIEPKMKKMLQLVSIFSKIKIIFGERKN